MHAPLAAHHAPNRPSATSLGVRVVILVLPGLLLLARHQRRCHNEYRNRKSHDSPSHLRSKSEFAAEPDRPTEGGRPPKVAPALRPPRERNVDRTAGAIESPKPQGRRSIRTIG